MDQHGAAAAPWHLAREAIRQNRSETGAVLAKLGAKINKYGPLGGPDLGLMLAVGIDTWKATGHSVDPLLADVIESCCERLGPPIGRSRWAEPLRS